MEDVVRRYEAQLVSSEEEGAGMVWILLAPGVGVLIEFVVPEAEDGEGGGGGEVGGGGADMHIWGIQRRRESVVWDRV